MEPAIAFTWTVDGGDQWFYHYHIITTTGAEAEEKEAVRREDLDAVVVEVRDENISVRVDSHVVRPSQLGGGAATTAELTLCFSLRSEDKDRAALSSQQSQHGKCPAVTVLV